MGERDPARLGIAGVVVLLLGLVALNVDSLPIIGAGTVYAAEFADAGGLRTDDEVGGVPGQGCLAR